MQIKLNYVEKILLAPQKAMYFEHVRIQMRNETTERFQANRGTIDSDFISENRHCHRTYCIKLEKLLPG